MQTLREAHAKITKKATFAFKVPFAVWLFENPKSPLSLPGSIRLSQHDYVHCLLHANIRLPGEAFVIGFTMGCDPHMTRFHVWLYKLVGIFYPKKYRFQGNRHWILFERGLELAKQACIKDLDKFDFESWLDKPIKELRELFFGTEHFLPPEKSAKSVGIERRKSYP